MNPLSAVQMSEITSQTQRCIELANTALQISAPMIEIHFNVSGAVWGYFVRRRAERYLRYNPFLFEKHFQEGLRDTIPHEVAHYMVDYGYPRKRLRPHGPEWRHVMSLLGVDNPSATHSTDLTGITQRRQRRFEYQCRCKTVQLSATRHNRIQSGQASYRCPRCGDMLKQK